MKPEIAAGLVKTLDERELPPITVTGGERGDGGTVVDVPRMTRAVVRAHDTVLRAVLVDLPKRRWDIEDWAGRTKAAEETNAQLAGWVHELEQRVAELEHLNQEKGLPAVQEDRHWGWAVAGATFVGGLSVWVVLLSAVVICLVAW